MHKYLIKAAILIGLLTAPAFAQERDGHKPLNILKICKVGIGFPSGTPFQFKVTPPGNIVTVQSGPPPGGNCWIAGAFPAGVVAVSEIVPAGYIWTSVSSSGPMSGFPTSPVNGSAVVSGNVTLGPGVTVVTFTNERSKLGYLEICKVTGSPGSYTFGLTPGATTSVTVPLGGCSPPIQVPAGTITITEAGPSGMWATCAPYQGGNGPIPCTVSPPNKANVTVVAGGVQAETLVLVYNKQVHGQGADAPVDNTEALRALRSLNAPPPPSQ